LCIAVCSLLAMQAVRDPFLCWALAGSVLLCLTALLEPAGRRELLPLACLLPASVLLVAYANHVVILLRPQTMDGTLLWLDHGVSRSIYHWTLRHRLFQLGVVTVYRALPFFAALIVGSSPRRVRCAIGLAIAGVVAPLFYLALPAVGPAHIGDPGAARNCIPSLHLTWAMLLVRYSHPRFRCAAMVFAVLTAVATLATGEHYIVDLVAAVPYTLAVVWMTERAGAVSLSAREAEIVCETV